MLSLIESGKSLPMRGEWIEMREKLEKSKDTGSLPMRGEWIEIFIA